MFGWKALLAVALFAIAPLTKAVELVENQNYRVIADSQSPGPKVIEFFSYGCPHCYKFEPFLNDWLSKKPKIIKFTRVPATLGHEVWEILAKAYYVGEELHMLDKSHEALFKRIHEEHKPIENDEDLKAFFVSLGAKPDDVDLAMKSLEVSVKLQLAKRLTEEFQVMSTPSFVVNDKYYTDAGMAGAQLGEVLDALALKGQPAIFQ